MTKSFGALAQAWDPRHNHERGSNMGCLHSLDKSAFSSLLLILIIYE